MQDNRDAATGTASAKCDARDDAADGLRHAVNRQFGVTKILICVQITGGFAGIGIFSITPFSTSVGELAASACNERGGIDSNYYCCKTCNLCKKETRRDNNPVGNDDRIVLSMDGLSKAFRGFVAVNNVHIDVLRGTIHSLIGPNGAGKTTIFNLVTRFLDPTSGRIFFNGQDVTRLKPAHVARLGMVRSFQISAVFLNLTVLENVRIALQRTRRDNFHFWRSERVLSVLDDRSKALLAQVGLDGFYRHKANELSYGRRRALELATTLALDPELLLLDEPTSGMGHEDIGRTVELIRRAAENRTIVMVEHNLSVVADLSDRITVLARGEILADGNYEQVSKNPAVIEAYMGTGGD